MLYCKLLAKPRLYDNLTSRYKHNRTTLHELYRASALTLVIAAIVYWITLYMDHVVEHLHGLGHYLPDALLAQAAPLGWR